MRRFVHFGFFMVFLASSTDRLHAQQIDTPTHLIRIYEDNDFINIWGHGTDNAYTNGTRLDYFYDLPHPSRFFIDKALPKAGEASINTYGWGIVQLMYTPDHLSKPDYQPHDYPWSGALFATHTLYSYNPTRKYDIQTELVLGVIGSAALGKEAQTLLHRWEGYPLPQGWGHQFSNDLLLNINVTAEKQLARVGQAVEIIGGGQVAAGTMQNSLTLYPLIRFGNMTPYFNGFISQYASTRQNQQGRRKGQFYFFVKPEAQLVVSYAPVQGGLFTNNPNLRPGESTKPPIPYPNVNTLQASLTYGAVFSSGNFGLSFSQTTSSAQLKGLYCHQVGNISLHFSW